jgi:predicted PurR-regulated permease PerM
VQPSRQAALASLLVALAVLTAFVLAEVLATVIFAVTLAYVLLPVRTMAVTRGASARVAAAAATTLASVVAVLFLAPVTFVLYQRRNAVVAFIEALPEELPISIGDRTFVIEVAPLLDQAQAALSSVALDMASAAPVIVLKALVLVLLLYGLLYRPSAINTAANRVLPRTYHEVLMALHRRTAETLEAIYVLQAATAVGTFVLGTVTFWVLGYESPLVLGVISGILQFIPVLGPSVLVVLLAGLDVVAGNVPHAITVLVVGLSVVGFLPDAVIRTQLAEYTTELPVSLYFVGFVGGILTLGAIGFVLGPLVVALLVESVVLLADGTESAQRRLDEQARMAAERETRDVAEDPAESGDSNGGSESRGGSVVKSDSERKTQHGGRNRSDKARRDAGNESGPASGEDQET